jgi:hypothetical protein
MKMIARWAFAILVTILVVYGVIAPSCQKIDADEVRKRHLNFMRAMEGF